MGSDVKFNWLRTKYLGSENLDSTSLERIVPDQLSSAESTGVETLQLHIERYRFAAQNLLPGTVLDIACGVGYGTGILAEKDYVKEAIGVDISHASIDYARERYPGKHISFLCSDALEFKPDHQYDNIVSLETIEHVQDPFRLFDNLVSMLKSGGRLIGSVPITPSVDANPHHRTNFSERKFLEMGKRSGLESLTSMSQIQRYSPFKVAMRTEKRSADLRHGLPGFYLRNPSHFFLRLSSLVRDGFVNKYLTVVWQKK